MNKPELGPPPIFEEEINCDHQCDRCGIPFTRLYAHHHFQFEKRLKAETQRADKAEEKFEYIKKMQFESFETRTRSEIPIAVYHQKLCDEIVGKLEDEKQHRLSAGQDSLQAAIDIVKSVLKVNGLKLPE